MRIAITLFRCRVSPVFDWSERLLVIDRTKDKELKNEVSLTHLGTMERVGFLAEARVKVLICGVISDPLVPVLESRNIRVIPGISGRVDDVIKAFFSGSLQQDKFTMPGCRGLRKRQRRFGRRHKGCSPTLGSHPDK